MFRRAAWMSPRRKLRADPNTVRVLLVNRGRYRSAKTLSRESRPLSLDKMNRGEGTGEFHDFVQRGGSRQIVRRSSEFVESDEVELRARATIPDAMEHDARSPSLEL